MGGARLLITSRAKGEEREGRREWLAMTNDGRVGDKLEIFFFFLKWLVEGWKGCIRICRDEGVVAALEHESGETRHDSVCLDMEVAEHDVGFPASDELDHVGIDALVE